jgi:hypothetical protein
MQKLQGVGLGEKRVDTVGAFPSDEEIHEIHILSAVVPV